MIVHPSVRGATLTEMIELFAVPWSEVELEHVRAFLDDAAEEGVTWEAKADEDDLRERDRPEREQPGRLGPHAIRKAVCGLANQIGGYLIAGARWDKAERRWRLPGVAVADPEPELGLGKVIRGLSPVPRFEARTWALDDERTVAVVWVEPVAEAPCMTPHGHVYERVSGETVRVDDPARLAALMRRGERARQRAEASASVAARRALDALDWRDDRVVGLTVALAAVGRETDDISSRLFTRSFRAEVGEATERLIPIRTSNPTRTSRTEQDAFSYFVQFEEGFVLLTANQAQPQHRTAWHLQATWDGAVAASMSFDEQAVWDLPDLDTLVRTGWRESVPLVERLGGYGPAHLVVGIESRQPPGHSLYGRLPAETWIARAVSVAAPDDDTIASVHREAQRAGGNIADEPEPEPK